MLDLKFIRENPDLVRAACAKKRMEVDVDRILELDRRLRELRREQEAVRAEQNAKSKEMPKLQGAEKAALLEKTRELAARLKTFDPEATALEAELQPLLLRVPNIPAPEVPDGRDDSENVEIRRVGVPRTFDFKPRDHVELGELLDALDVERAARIAGSRTYFLKNDGALLELAVLKYAFDHMVSAGFTPMLVPHLVRDEAMLGTAYLPGGEEQAYRCDRDDGWLIGTAEVPVTAYRMGEILDESELPVKMAGWSPCYRREAGTYGKDTRGIYRIHQFQKVEQVVLCRNDVEESKRFHDEILGHAETILRNLELPYRVVDVCGGDLGRPQVRKFDVETWMPSRNGYGETHSASRFHDFQSRRLNIRYRDAGGTVRFVHTLNNTVIASPRILIPLLENHQQADGSVAIPKVLRPYMNGREVIVPRPRRKG
ncbi:MAG TPA: serine--tRNA ligase [Planctomycetota bacterium]|nr:serine--tRNA ligase [Planctomycetota bacterium]